MAASGQGTREGRLLLCGIVGVRCPPVVGYLFVGISVVDEDRVPTSGAPLIHTCPPDCDSPILWDGLSVDVR